MVRKVAWADFYVFSELSCIPDSYSDDVIVYCEQLVLAAYDPQDKFKWQNIHDLRITLFNASSIILMIWAAFLQHQIHLKSIFYEQLFKQAGFEGFV